MKKFSERPAGSDAAKDMLELPSLPDSARRPPVLTLDQYFVWNMQDVLNEGANAPTSPHEKCGTLFELKR